MLRRVIICALLCSLTVELTGCAATINRSFRATDPSTPPRCTSSRVGVVLDGVFASLYGLIGLSVAADSEAGVAVPFLALGAAHVTSGYFGNKSARRCKKARRDHKEWVAARDRRLELADARPEPEPARTTADEDATAPEATAQTVEADDRSGPDEADADGPDTETDGPDDNETAPPAPARMTDEERSVPPRQAPDDDPDDAPDETSPPTESDPKWSDFWREINL